MTDYFNFITQNLVHSTEVLNVKKVIRPLIWLINKHFFCLSRKAARKFAVKDAKKVCKLGVVVWTT